jgi:hypothetical protein
MSTTDVQTVTAARQPESGFRERIAEKFRGGHGERAPRESSRGRVARAQ